MTQAQASLDKQEEYLYRFWSVEAGLPQISVTAIEQDDAGYLWVGTQNGLARFDGVNFTVFNTANSPAFSSNFITAIHFDKQQRLWIGTANGLIRYQDNKFSALDKVRLHNGISDIVEQEDGAIYIGAGDLYQWNEQLESLQRVLAHQGVVTSLLNHQDILYIGGQSGFAVLNQDGYQWYTAPDNLGELQVLQLGLQEGDLYLGTTNGLIRWHNHRWYPMSLPDHPDGKQLEMFYSDPEQRLWVASYKNLYQIFQREVFTAQQVQGKFEEFSWIEAMLRDKFGNLWLGSHAYGLKRLRKPQTQRYSTKQGIADPFVWSLQPWREHMLVGTNNGLSLLNDGQFETVPANKHIPNPLVYSMFLDSKHRLWLGLRGGLSRLDGNTLVWQQNYDSISHLMVSSFAEENERVWVGTNRGLYFVKENKLQLQLEPEVLQEAQVRTVALDSKHRLWVGTENGLYLREGDSFTELKDLPISGGFISVVKEFSDGNILIGSLNYGFVFGQPGEWYWFNQNNGLPGNGIIYVEKVANHLIVTNLEGAYRLNYAALSQGKAEQVYMMLDDRRPESVTDSRRCCNGAGSSKGALYANQLWFPTLDGVLAFPVEQLEQYGPIPQPVLESLTASGQQYFNHKTILTPEQRDWHFRFTAPFYTLPSSLMFRYQLEGYDNSWIDAGSRREAFYTNLPPGQYRFTVQSRLASDYRWSDAVSMDINLQYYWYETNTARIVVLLLFILLFWLLYRWRLMNLASAKQKLEILVQERTNELHQANQKLQRLSMQDALTGLANRHYLDTNIKQIISRSDRSSRPLIWALLDLDHFKQINDTFGHQVGDNVIKVVAELLQTNSRQSDHIIRWGGEEFLLLLEHSADALLVLKRIHQAIGCYPWQQEMGLKQPLTCSIGAITQLKDWDWQHSLRLADHALYWVKEHGRNGYMLLEVSSPPQSELLAETLNISQLLVEGKLKANTNLKFASN
ncbi:diguanylate cyclase [Rheinheimera sp. MMS21-TC3]|uniref:diguanylate cyclase n=1 Tax=Rheinheimera sp. MMS21-TC3 TaxID=3072790 RepID=UPI0028C3B80C|nr:diguanylate cyclase [Rheinheimera sp. MMS21-TC3]WNO60065.1 diguanylate cyclase [Rheinheimera sp. MMS21-TC3]